MEDLEGATRIRVGQGRHERVIVRQSMEKKIKNEKLNLRKIKREKDNFRIGLRIELGSDSSRFKRLMTHLNKQAKYASQTLKDK